MQFLNKNLKIVKNREKEEWFCDQKIKSIIFLLVVEK